MSLVNDIMTVAETRLKQISTENDYDNTVRKVERPARHGGFLVEDKVVVLTHDEIEIDPELSHAGNPPSTAWVLPLNVAGIIMPDEDDLTPIDERMDSFGADMQAAIMDATDWHQFGGNAINAAVGPLLPFHPGDDSSRGIQFKVRVTYRTQETKPNILAG